MAKILISLNSSVVGRSTLWNELGARKKAGKITQKQYNDCIKLLNSNPAKLKDLIAKGLTPAKAATSIIRSVSSVESVSAPVVTRSGLWNELGARKKAGKISQAQYNACIKAVNGDPSKLKAWASKGMTAAKAATSLIRSVASE